MSNTRYLFCPSFSSISEYYILKHFYCHLLAIHNSLFATKISEKINIRTTR